MLRFEDWFWGTPADPTVGVHVLHEHYQMGIAEMEELLAFLSQRKTAEEQYASKLTELSQLKPRADGFGKDESLLAQIFGNAKQEMANLGTCHKQSADQISQLIHPLQRFLDDNRKLSIVRKDKIDSTWRSLSGQRSELDGLVQDYKTKCGAADVEQRKFEQSRSEHDLPSMDVMISMGPRSFTVEDFNTLLLKMQREIRTQDVKSLWGSSKNCFSGDDALQYLRVKLHLDEEGAISMLSQMINEGFIRNIGRGHRFSTSSHYQWKRLSIENEPLHRKTRREAERADFEYRKAVEATEETRLFLESACWEYMNSLQHIETRRMEIFKESLLGLNNAEKSIIAGTRNVCERNQVYLETLSPAKEIEIMIESQRTGNVRLPPAVYHNYYGNSYRDPVFGVSLEDYAASRGRKVPLLVKKCLRAIEDTRQGATERGEGPEVDLWLEPNSNIPALHALRTDLNNSKASLKYLRRLPTSLIIGALKLYLIELPTSVCSDEIYEPLKLLYLSKADDFGPMRIASLRSLLATMPPPHYCTLRLLSEHWHKLIAQFDAEDPKISDFAQNLGHYVLRPRVHTQITLHDKHPVRMMKDLLLHHDKIFSLDEPLELPEAPDDGRSFRSVHISDLEDSEEEDIDETASTRALYDASSRVTGVTSGSSSERSMRTGYSLTLVGDNLSDRRASLSDRGVSSASLTMGSFLVNGLRRDSTESHRSGATVGGAIRGIGDHVNVPLGVDRRDSSDIAPSSVGRRSSSSFSDHPTAMPATGLLTPVAGDSDDEDLDIQISADGIVTSRTSSASGSAVDLITGTNSVSGGSDEISSPLVELPALKIVEDGSESEVGL
ncbi:hypothetical protein SpCBS45565_g01234 [Spizellomyces sp. 'palustris']|nr:hypothetical protein SpCBS45565_g01234 [Spizellomyces sp. 'palustris']